MSEDFKLFEVRFDDEGIETPTSKAELGQEDEIKKVLIGKELLLKKKHYTLITRMIEGIIPGGTKKEQQSIWFPFYTISALQILEYPQGEKFDEFKAKYTNFLKDRILEDGGFSGYKQDFTNTISLYGVIIGIMAIGTEEAYKLIDRKKIYDLLISLKQPDGSFLVSIDGESDIRSTEVAIVISKYLNILDDKISEKTADFVLSCQNYDGGFSPVPHCESHGGYIYCGIACLAILNRLEDINLSSCIRYLSSRQSEFAGGFNGRTNKLVDTCYTFWIGATMRIICDHFKIPEFWDKNSLTQYCLCACQFLFGGFCDHPPSQADPFHTIYTLAGIGVAGDREKYEIPAVDPFSGVPQELSQKFLNYFLNLQN